MKKQETKGRGSKPAQKEPVGDLESQLPIVASARTGLAGKDEAILRRIPIRYSGKTVREALDYIVGAADLSDSELPLAESVKKELRANGSVVVVNGKPAKLDDSVAKYLVTREHELPDKSKRVYSELEIEVSAVQQGGLYSLLRYILGEK